VLTFDRLSSVISNTNHEENQPAHLKLRDPAKAIEVNWNQYRSPETRYCPAALYQIVGAEEGAARVQINAQTASPLQDVRHRGPLQNIDWVTQGGDGPNYPGGCSVVNAGRELEEGERRR
jgi:electron-transferring-flavoprotein dehydrogenase